MGIDIKRNRNLLTNLNIETLQTVSTKYAEYHFARVGIMGLDDKILGCPFSSC